MSIDTAIIQILFMQLVLDGLTENVLIFWFLQSFSTLFEDILSALDAGAVLLMFPVELRSPGSSDLSTVSSCVFCIGFHLL